MKFIVWLERKVLGIVVFLKIPISGAIQKLGKSKFPIFNSLVTEFERFSKTKPYIVVKSSLLKRYVVF